MRGKLVVLGSALTLLLLELVVAEELEPNPVFQADSDKPKATNTHLGTGIVFPYRVRPFSRQSLRDFERWGRKVVAGRAAEPGFGGIVASQIPSAMNSLGGFVHYEAPLDRVKVFMAIRPHLPNARTLLFHDSARMAANSLIGNREDNAQREFEARGRMEPVKMKVGGIELAGDWTRFESRCDYRIKEPVYLQDLYTFEVEKHFLHVRALYPLNRKEASQAMVIKLLEDLSWSDPDIVQKVARRAVIAESPEFKVAAAYMRGVFACDGRAILDSTSRRYLESHQFDLISKLAAVSSADKAVLLRWLFGEPTSIGELRAKPAGYVAQVLPERMTKPFLDAMELDVERVTALQSERIEGDENLRAVQLRLRMRSGGGSYVTDVELAMEKEGDGWKVRGGYDFFSWREQFKATVPRGASDGVPALEGGVRYLCVRKLLAAEAPLSTGDKADLFEMLDVAIRCGGEGGEAIVKFASSELPGHKPVADCSLEEEFPIMATLSDIPEEDWGKGVRAALNRELDAFLESDLHQLQRIVQQAARGVVFPNVRTLARSVNRGRIALEIAKLVGREDDSTEIEEAVDGIARILKLP